jgi:hypothetical protein
MRFIGTTVATTPNTLIDIDASGNFILSKNEPLIYMSNMHNITIDNFMIYGVRGFKNKAIASVRALAFIWGGVK